MLGPRWLADPKGKDRGNGIQLKLDLFASVWTVIPNQVGPGLYIVSEGGCSLPRH